VRPEKGSIIRLSPPRAAFGQRAVSLTHWGVWLHAIHPLPELGKLAAAAEALGAKAILVADEGTDRDLFVTLAALAQRTRHVLLVGAVTNPHSRHPVTTAAAFASLAELAPGRIVAGFGTGGTRVFGPLGLAPPRPYSSLVECVDVVEALWRGETVTHHGEFDLNAARLPWSPGPVPLALAGRGPRAERLAAERADWVLLAGRSVQSVPALFARLRELGVRAGGRAPKIAWNPVAAWTEAMREDLRAHLAYMAVDMPEADRLAIGVDSRATAGAHAVISDEALERYAIVGDRHEVIARLANLCEQLEPELLVFDAGDYSVQFLEDVASLATSAGANRYQPAQGPS